MMGSVLVALAAATTPAQDARVELNGTAGWTFSDTTWAAGLKSSPNPKGGLRIEGRWTPTYLKSDPAGYWCDPYWGCYTFSDAEFSNQFELSGSVPLRFRHVKGGSVAIGRRCPPVSGRLARLETTVRQEEGG